jgi:hypothetical protein
MVRRVKARRAAAEVPDLGMRTREGVLEKRGSGFFLKVGRTRQEIPVGQFLDPADLNKLAGKEVLVGYSGSSIVVIVAKWPVTRPPRFPCVMCYYPAPNLLRRIRPEMKEVLLRRFVKDRIISPQLADQLRR